MKNPLPRRIRLGLVVTVSLWLHACVTTEPARSVPHVNLSPETMQFVPTADGRLAFGIDAAANESDSLENLALLPGLKVRQVRAGSPADRAGLRSGDVILSINGIATDTPDVLASIATAAITAEILPLKARRGTTVFETQLPVPDSRETIVPEERYRIDPTKTRAGYRTELIHDASSGTEFTAARIAELLPDSPLTGAGLTVNDAIVAINGESLDSAQDLIDTIHNRYDFGETVNLDILRDNGPGLSRFQVRAQLWDPGRRLREFTLWPLVSYRSDPAARQTRFALFDLWLFSLFAYERNRGEKEYSLLSLITFSTGHGQLVDESGDGESH